MLKRFITIWSKKEILVIFKRLYKSRKKCYFYWLDYLYYLLNKQKNLHLFGLSLCLWRSVENLCTTHLLGVAFMVSAIISLNDSFSNCPMTGLIELTMYLNICFRMLKQVFCMTGILFFVLIPRYDCFGVMCVSRSMEQHLRVLGSKML